MELVFNTTRGFEKDLKKYRGPDRERVTKTVNQLATYYVQDPIVFRRHVSQFSRRVFGGFESSLYSARLSARERLIFSAEDDPLFDEVVFTLFALTDPDRYPQVLAGIAESLYQIQTPGPDGGVSFDGPD